MNVEMPLELLAACVWFVHQLMDDIGKHVYVHIYIAIFALCQHHQYVCQQAQNSGMLKHLCVYIN